MLKLQESATSIKVWGPVNELKVLAEAFKFRPEGFWRADSYQIYQATDGTQGWDGYLHNLKLKFPRGEVPYGIIRRGFKDDLLAEIKKNRFELSPGGLIDSPFAQLVPDDLPDSLIKGEFDLDENQRRCITEWLKHGMGVNKMAVNSGKTATFAGAAAMIKRKFPKARFLYFTMTERLVNQVTKELKTKFLPDWDIAQMGGGKNEVIFTDHKDGRRKYNPNAGRDIVVATGASLNSNFKKLVELKWFNTFMGVLVDECFPAGTLIDGKKIETLKVGDEVHSMNGTRVETRRILSVFKSRPTSMVRVNLSDKTSIICTPGHPILTDYGYIPASLLCSTDRVMYLRSENRNLHRVQNSCSGISSKTIFSEQLRCLLRNFLLFGNLRSNKKEEKSKTGRREMQKLRSFSDLLRRKTFISESGFFQKRFSLLLGEVSGPPNFSGVFQDDGVDQSKIRFEPNEGQQSFLSTGSSRKNIGFKEGKRTISAERKRKLNRTPEDFIQCAHFLQPGYGTSNLPERGSVGTIRQPTNELSGRHRDSCEKDCNRSGRWEPSKPEAETERLVENEETGILRVDSVEILEQSSDGTFGGVCSDGFVYNVEVEGNHNYFADGILTHNCHHACSPTWEKVLLKVPAYFRLGASDTAKEKDLKKFYTIRGLVGPERDEVEIGETIDMGRSAKPFLYLVDNESWTGKFSAYEHQAEEGSPAWVLLDGEWVKGTYNGKAYEKAEPDEKTGEYASAEKDGYRRERAKVQKDGSYREGEEDGFKRDDNGDTILIPIPSYHRIQIESEELELPSRWCLLDRLYDKAVVTFKQRNSLIADWAEHFSNQNYQTLVVATRTLHVLILEALIKKRVGEDMVKILFSEHSTKQRDKVFDWLRETPGSVLITPLVKEGVSINELRAGIIADHIVDFELAKQVIGRFVRKKIKGVPNEAHVVWFVDRQHPNLRRNSLNLFKELEQVRGYTFFHPLLGPDTVASAARYEAAY